MERQKAEVTVEVEKSQPTMYDHGRNFYEGEIKAARSALDSAESPFDRLMAKEHLELSMMKLAHINRREQVLEKGGELDD